MSSLHKRRRLRVLPALSRQQLPSADPTQDLIIEGYRPTQMIADLRKYQAELEIQNKALRYSQQEAEGASERFATLFSSVPLALMVVVRVAGPVMVAAVNTLVEKKVAPLVDGSGGVPVSEA